MKQTRAQTRYKYGKYRGKTIPKQEIDRRIQQSLLSKGFYQAPAEERIVQGVSTKYGQDDNNTIIVA